MRAEAQTNATDHLTDVAAVFLLYPYSVGENPDVFVSVFGSKHGFGIASRVHAGVCSDSLNSS
jgi:hypothetical protein